MFSASPGGIDTDVFLSEYWQKKPLLIKNALPDFQDYLTPEELAGLSLEDEVESRLVFNSNDTWSMKSGPFSERDFTFLPEHDWTLLVQSVDHWLPSVKELLQHVPFLPTWRLDDVMISYAARNGGVGPHFDYYDVFLVQGMGSRRWQTGARCNSQSGVNTSSGLKILESFTPEHEWTLESGDILYIPAGLSHYGIAMEPGLSYSIGFRAPDLPELLGAISLQAEDTFTGDIRYRDPRLSSSSKPGEIDEAAIQQINALLQTALNEPDFILESFGRLMTDPRLPELLELPETALSPTQLANQLQKGLQLTRHPVTRMACHHAGNVLHLFINGGYLRFDSPNEHLLGLNYELQSAVGRPLQLARYQRNEACLDLLSELYNQGILVSEDSL